MACSSCYNNPSPCPSCGCDPTPPPCPEPIPIVCPDPEPCDQAIDSVCVIYTGGDLPCIGITAGTPPIIRLDEILEKLDTAVCNSGLAITFVQSSNCISLTGQGTSISPIVAAPIINLASPGNILSCTPQGLVATLPTNLLTAITIADTNCVNLSGNGTVATPLSADLNFDSVGSNLLSCTASGLKATLNIQDSNCIDLTGNGTAGSPLSATLNLNGTSLLCEAGGLSVNPAALDFLTFNNGLTRTSNNVQLGGTLVQDTTINLSASNYNLSILGNTASNGFLFKNTEIKGTYSAGTAPTDLSTILNQKALEFSVIGTTYSNISTSVYTSKAFLSVNPNGSTTVLATAYPIGGSTLLQETAGFTTGLFNATTRAYQVNINTPGTSITSGSLVAGKKYVITDNTGGADFTAATAATITNTVGVIFLSNGVTPTWGTGAVQIYGEVLQSSPYVSTTLGRRGFDILVSKDQSSNPLPVAGSTDLGLVSTYNPGYYETQTYSALRRNDISGTYIAEGVVVLASPSTGGSKYAKIGVDVPTKNLATATLVDNIVSTSYTQWYGNESGITNGTIRNYAPYVSFLGLKDQAGTSPIVNGGFARVGVNVDAATLDTITTVLNIDGPINKPLVNIAKDYIPATSTALGVKGDITWGADYIYVCIATNTWKRAALVSW